MCSLGHCLVLWIPPYTPENSASFLRLGIWERALWHLLSHPGMFFCQRTTIAEKNRFNPWTKRNRLSPTQKTEVVFWIRGLNPLLRKHWKLPQKTSKPVQITNRVQIVRGVPFQGSPLRGSSFRIASSRKVAPNQTTNEAGMWTSLAHCPLTGTVCLV